MQIYVGSLSHPEIKEKVENAKLILSVGALKSDFNTGNFTYHIPVARTIEVCVCELPHIPANLMQSHSCTPTTSRSNMRPSRVSA